MINMQQTAGHITDLKECFATMGLCFSGDNNTICAISAFFHPEAVIWECTGLCTTRQHNRGFLAASSFHTSPSGASSPF